MASAATLIIAFTNSPREKQGPFKQLLSLLGGLGWNQTMEA